MSTIDHQFEPEFLPTIPRPIPAELYRGRHARGQLNQIVGVAVAGVLCVFFYFLPFVRTLELYLLPLAYLHWLGAGLLAFALGAYVVFRVRQGPYRYVIEGVPLPARIVEVGLRSGEQVQGMPVLARFVAVFAYRDPFTGEERTGESMSYEFAASELDKLTCTVEAGGTATAVYLPQDGERTPRLYDFLDLRPGVGVVKKGGAGRMSSPFVAAIVVLGIVGMLFLLFWDLYALGRYHPLKFEWSMLLPAGVGAAVGVGLLIFAVRKEVRGNDQAKVGVVGAVAAAVVMLSGAALLGGITGFCWALTLNAWLDGSRARPRPMQVEEMVSVTHNFVFRHYEIKYKLTDEPGGEKRQFLSTPWEMGPFFGVRRGWADEKEGYFGWAWIEGLRPLGE